MDLWKIRRVQKIRYHRVQKDPNWIGRLLRNTNSLTTAGSAYMMQPREEMIPNILPQDRGNPVN